MFVSSEINDYLCSMNKKEYLIKCGATTSKDLSAEQVLAYFIDGNGGSRNRHAATVIKWGAFGMKPDRAKGIAMLRQAFDDDKILEVNFVNGEGVLNDDSTIPTSHFTMKFRKS